MNNLIETQSLESEAIEQIWKLVSAVNPPNNVGHVAFSFQGAGTRTRTTFVQAISDLGLNYIELPLFLETKERTQV